MLTPVWIGSRDQQNLWSQPEWIWLRIRLLSRIWHNLCTKVAPGCLWSNLDNWQQWLFGQIKFDSVFVKFCFIATFDYNYSCHIDGKFSQITRILCLLLGVFFWYLKAIHKKWLKILLIPKIKKPTSLSLSFCRCYVMLAQFLIIPDASDLHLSTMSTLIKAAPVVLFTASSILQ